MEWRIARLGTHQTVIFAEQELRKYLTQLTPGIEIAVLSETDYISDRKGMLWIGCSAAFREMLPSVEDAVLDDAIYIDVKNGEGIITGTNERSVLLAVYRFLREFGCRWVRPGKLGEIIPHVEYPEQKEIYICEKASYRHRGVCIEGFDSYDHIEQMLDWLPKIGMNSYFIQFMVPYTFFNKWYAHVQNPYMQKQRVTVEEVDGMVTALTEAAKVRSLLLHRVGHGWTCEPFGLAGNGWDAQGNEISEEIRPYLALVNGKRELWNQIALTTNLCYSNPYVRQTISTAVVDYAKKHPETDYLHVWLADDCNNHCECENCRDTRPADFYIQLLNEIDEGLIKENLSTKIVFLLYVDLLWPPEKERLNHPERFVLMFAPSTRSYTTPLYKKECSGSGKIAPFIRNQLQMPQNAEDNIEHLRQWQKLFSGDSFIFEYHLCWDVNYDLSVYRTAQVLFKDMQDLHLLGLNGMISCQLQRIFLPNGLAMTAMAAALWNRNADYDDLQKGYFEDIYGEYAEEMRIYLETLSDLLDARYLRKELPTIDEKCAEKFRKIPDWVKRYMPVFQAMQASAQTSVQRTTWANMILHGELCIRFSEVLAHRASGNFKEADACWNEMKDFMNRIEPEIHPFFDVLFYMIIVGRALGYEDSPDYRG